MQMDWLRETSLQRGSGPEKVFSHTDCTEVTTLESLSVQGFWVENGFDFTFLLLKNQACVVTIPGSPRACLWVPRPPRPPIPPSTGVRDKCLCKKLSLPLSMWVLGFQSSPQACRKNALLIRPRLQPLILVLNENQHELRGSFLDTPSTETDLSQGFSSYF